MEFIKITKKRYFIMGFLLLAAILLSACGSDANVEEENAEDTEQKNEDGTENEEDDESDMENESEENDESEDNEEAEGLDELVDVFDELAASTSDVDEDHVTGDIEIGEDEEVEPGIYDLKITGGFGNVTGERSDVTPLFINWVAGEEGNDAGHPSKIRMILFEGDTLEFSDISKVKFDAVSEDVDASNELGIGEFIVGRDIDPGEYKLSTNVDLDPEFGNLGWDITIYNDESGDTQDQTLTPDNDDVAVDLEEGEIISTSYDGTTGNDEEKNADDAKLEFKEK